MDDINDRRALIERLKAERAALESDTARRRRELVQRQRDTLRRERGRAEPPEEQASASTDTETAAANTNAWCGWIDQRIANALAERERFMLEVVGEALGEALGDERKAIDLEVKTKLLELKLAMIERMESTLTALRKAVEPGAAELPATPRREVIN
jgi:hypothetical protein